MFFKIHDSCTSDANFVKNMFYSQTEIPRGTKDSII